MKSKKLTPASILLALLSLAGNIHAASKTWSNSGGDPSKAAYSVGSTVQTSANAASAVASGNAYADVAAFGSGYRRIASASATVTATKSSLSGNGSVQFLGGNLWSFNHGVSVNSINSSMAYVSRSWAPPVSPRFTVGPVVVTVKPSVSVGLSGNVSASISTTNQSFTGSLVPVGMDCGLTVTASALGGLARANGSLTVCRLNPTLTSTCSWKTRTISSNAGLSYGTLGGSINLEAGKSWYEVTWNLASWQGFSGYTSLFNESARF